MQSLTTPFISAACRLELRRLKGRDQRGGTTRQFDVGLGGLRAPTIAPDPILDLFVARQNFVRKFRRGEPGIASRYGALRQTVVSPVVLP